MPKMQSLLIATPTTGGTIKAKTAETLSNLVKVLTRLKIDTQVHIINNSDIVTARNLYANMVLNSERWDALLFIDSDMSFKPEVIVRLIKLNVPVSAAACTKKVMELDKFASSFAAHNDIERARTDSVYFNTMLSWGGAFTVRRTEGFVTAAAVGMAVCLIRKQALKALVAGDAVEQRLNVYEGVKSTSWGFFDYTKHDGITLTEDYAFCYRWTKLLGRPLWVSTDAAVDHIGDFNYGGNYALKLEELLSSSKVSKQKQAEPAPPATASAPKAAAKRRKRAPSAS